MAWPNKTAEAERIVANFMVKVNTNTGDADIAGLPKKYSSEIPPFYTHLPLPYEWCSTIYLGLRF